PSLRNILLLSFALLPCWVSAAIQLDYSWEINWRTDNLPDAFAMGERIELSVRYDETATPDRARTLRDGTRYYFDDVYLNLFLPDAGLTLNSQGTAILNDTTDKRFSFSSGALPGDQFGLNDTLLFSLSFDDDGGHITDLVDLLMLPSSLNELPLMASIDVLSFDSDLSGESLQRFSADTLPYAERFVPLQGRVFELVNGVFAAAVDSDFVTAGPAIEQGVIDPSTASLSLTIVPEPSALGFALCGLLLIALRRRR
ncbi:MAG: hypothetical protein AAGF10_02290, partial [Verrucomicrobiota bacterium]